ncbi:MAG: choice-of-anchor L domain-containing protein [Bacteroidota bacterium]
MKKNYRFALLMLPFIFNSISTLTGQNMVVSSGPPFTPENLINNVFLGEGVEVIDVNYNGVNAAVGVFSNGQDLIGIDRGIVMSTGLAETSGFDFGVDQNSTEFASVDNTSLIIDPDLERIAGPDVDLANAAIYTIEFIPISDTLQFNYVFGSEEYPDFTCSDFNDIFGFFISGPGISGPFENNAANIALIPGTDRPVTINNVNSGEVGTLGDEEFCRGDLGSLAFSQFYVDNDDLDRDPVFNGFTTVLTAEAVVVPCSTYTIKLAITDVGDPFYDSGVFLEAKSFGTGSLDVQLSTFSLDGSVVEGCATGILSFSLPTPAEADVILDYSVFGTAENGIDYEAIPEDLIIPAGDSTISVPLVAIEDGIAEGVETILIDIQLDPCTRDTFTVLVRDNQLVERDLGNDTTICQGNSIQLDGTLPVPLPAPPNFSNTNEVLITPTNVPVNSPIEVSGIIPPTLAPGVIKSVCIDSLSHRWIDDMDVFLVAPDGKFVELTTDNGGNGGNGLGPDFYIGTCFTEDADAPIAEPGTVAGPEGLPFTGDWQPEGFWEDIYGSPSNGTWQLQLIDDTNGLTGTLHAWSICFNPLYTINYTWEPSTGLSCGDCPDPLATPDTTTTYVMTAIDSYGCEYVDSITITVIEQIPAPELTCTNVSGNSVSIYWEPIPGAEGYEVSVNSGPWTPPNDGATGFTVSGLSIGEMVAFMVRSLGACEGDTAMITCETLNCSSPVVNTIVNNINCADVADGSIILDITTADPPFRVEFNGADAGTTTTFNNLPAGNYTINVIDNIGCSSFLAIPIESPAVIEIMPINVADATCVGALDGTATLVVNGGNPPYTFNWESGVVDSIATTLGAGPQVVTITDANNCSQIDTILIGAPEAITLDEASTAVSCFGVADGTATAIVTGGTPPLAFQWDAATGDQTTATASSLSGGTYTVTVTDSNNCQSVTAVTVEEPSMIDIELSSVNLNCSGGADGSVTALATGGAGTFTYEWNNTNTGEVVGTTESVSDLPEGEYSLVVTDSDDCTATATITLTAPPALTVALITSTAPTCAEDANGTAILAAEGGTSTYTYQWSDGVSTMMPIRDDLLSGTYQVTATDQNDCEATTEVVIPSTSPIILTLTSQPISCSGEADGTVQLVSDGGTGDYTYNWSNGAMTADLSNLPAGTYSVTVTDENDCVGMQSVTITEPSEISLTVEGIDPLCFGADGGVGTITATGGTGDFSYSWNNGNSTATVNTLVAGTYVITVTDENNCEAIAELTLTDPPSLEATTSFGLVSCNGEPDGTATIEPAGGTAPYTYLWDDSNSQTTQQASGLANGTYQVTITDANGCTLLQSVEVLPSPAIELSTTTTNNDCFGATEGTIAVNATGGSPPYTYAWSNSLPSTPNQTGLAAGSYTLTVVDVNNCQVVQAIEITQPNEIVLNLNAFTTSCTDTQDGAVNLSTQGGVGQLSYLWSTGSIAQNIADLPAGFYSVTVTDENSCTASAFTEVNLPAPLDGMFEVKAVECFGENSGTIQTQITGGTPPYTYAWSNGATSSQLENIPAGSYELQLTDANNCPYTQQFTITQPDEPLIASVSADSVSCEGLRDGRITVLPSGGTPSYRYSLDGNTFGGSSIFIGLESGAYQVYIEDSEGCLFLTEVVEVEEPPAINVVLSGEDEVLFGDSIGLVAQVRGGRGILFYEWTPIDTSCFDCDSLAFAVPFQTSFKVKVTDEFGCSAEDILTVAVRKNTEVLVPTGFTPNGDQTNDRLLVHGREGIRVATFRIFDRWGEMVYEDGGFEVNDVARGWDGSFRGEVAQPGVYLWALEVIYLDGATDKLQGQTTLIR